MNQQRRALAWYGNNLDQLRNWWQQLVDQQEQSQVLPNAIDQRSRYAIASSSDRVNLGAVFNTNSKNCQVKHPISGQQHQIDSFNRISN
ncbi:MAG: hypothetical protein F6J94_25685 [Moorea sp. SIO1F2]|uniref:hypothetical protein n=1 Tax=Moorena sp. SIO1F2 TaxID=2607819 RepID=UPI0013BC6AAA|nr:hypothetical protein [Moorena sp. SIO1F2]NET85180.1 hypothetical protein [Moorena sp. SIO1F2]